MSTGIIASPIALPPTRVPISIRPATIADVPFMDSLQKLHVKQVGWMPRKQLEGKVALGQVLIAEAADDDLARDVTSEDVKREAPSSHALTSPRFHSSLLGYCIATDRYMKRDDLGIIYQMNVVPAGQRGLIGATLLKAMFDRAAWGCRLFCCWCAQDIAANRFWESMGFVPLAFRAGSQSRSRVHIFWQKRIRRGDTSTPWWYPSQTTGGSIREDRLVLPIPPGTHWSDAKPLILPSEQGARLEAPRAARAKAPKTLPVPKPPARRSITRAGQLWFAAAAPAAPVVTPIEKASFRPAQDGPKKPKAKNDPKLIAAAREMRDRWMERLNELGVTAQGKYEVSRMSEGPAIERTVGPLLLPAA